MQKTKAYNKEEVNDIISKYYDSEMNDLELINFEAEMALSKSLYKKCADECYKNFKISNSIRLVKIRQDLKAQKAAEEFKKYYDKSFINSDTGVFKSLYKCLRNIFLNMLRDNP